MADINTVARPYAKAAFEFALAESKLAQWQETLSMLALIASDEQIQPLLSNPNVPGEQLSELFIGICAEKIDDKGKNFIKLLAQNQRISALPAILLAFEHFKAEHEKSITVKVKTMVDLNDQQVSQITGKLETMLKRKIELTTEIDKSLLGGLIIEANDMVIDGSVRGKLEQLGSALQA